MPDAAPQNEAIVTRRGWMSGVMLRRVANLTAPWTNAATPAAGGPYPVLIYLPAIQPIIAWVGQSGPAGAATAHHRINQLSVEFFNKAHNAAQM